MHSLRNTSELLHCIWSFVICGLHVLISVLRRILRDTCFLWVWFRRITTHVTCTFCLTITRHQTTWPNILVTSQTLSARSRPSATSTSTLAQSSRGTDNGTLTTCCEIPVKLRKFLHLVPLDHKLSFMAMNHRLRLIGRCHSVMNLSSKLHTHADGLSRASENTRGTRDIRDMNR